MRTRIGMGIVTAVLVVGTAAGASAHPAGYSDDNPPPVYTGDTSVVTGPPDVPIARQSDNVEFIAHLPVANSSDMHFQRREGEQILDGQTIDRRLDIVVVGGISTPGVWIADITDPTNPQVLTTISCGGFHSEVVLYENLLVQSWDGSGPPCADDEPADPDGVDKPGDRGLRIYDLTDPAHPRLDTFIGSRQGITSGVHNLTVNNDAGLLYLNMAELSGTGPEWGYVDLTDPEFPLTLVPIRDISPTAGDGCHDSGIAPERKLLACAAITESLIWDISDPRNPVEVAVIPNPAISIHHGARWSPDERYLVLNDELGGAAVSPGCTGVTSEGTVGAMWFYDTTLVADQAPVLVGSFSTSDLNPDATEICTSHFYGFVSSSPLMPVGWYHAGIEIVDYSDAGGGFPVPSEYAYFEPEGSSMWSAYPWHGYVYGSSHDYGPLGSDDANPAVGLWIIKVEGIDDEQPAVTDEGNVWARWTAAEATPEAPAPEPTPEAAPEVDDSTDSTPLPTTGGGLALAGLLAVAAGATVRRRRR